MTGGSGSKSAFAEWIGYLLTFPLGSDISKLTQVLVRCLYPRGASWGTWQLLHQENLRETDPETETESVTWRHDFSVLISELISWCFCCIWVNKSSTQSVEGITQQQECWGVGRTPRTCPPCWIFTLSQSSWHYRLYAHSPREY